MTAQNYKKTKFACYFSYFASSTVFALPPLLFAIFRESYGISYTLLGTLVVVNFFTQLSVDLVFSFFAKKFNVKNIVRFMPLITSAGLVIYALIPTFFPNYAYLGLVIGTFVFSIAAGLSEVLISPTVAALPSDNPERDMSNLHSLYAYGLVFVIILSSIFLHFFGSENWMYLTLFWAVFPIIASLLFFTSPIPQMNTESEGKSSSKSRKRRVFLFLCMLCIFFGSAAENSMTNWISVYIESALRIPKLFGDILGMSAFALVLGLTRTVYAKYGKNITSVIIWSMVGALISYLVVSLSGNSIVGVSACILIGIFTSMLWPGILIFIEEELPSVGVGAYALMAAGGDGGASVGPQLIGALIDKVSESSFARSIAEKYSITAEQVGMKAGMLLGAVFPLVGLIAIIVTVRYLKKNSVEIKAK